MLQVRSLGASGRYLQSFSTGALDRASSSTVAFLIPFPYDSSFMTIVGRIGTGATDKFGDRQCLHNDVSGSLVHVDETVIKTTIPPIVPNSLYAKVSGLSTPAPAYEIVRSTGTKITMSGLLVPPGTSATLRLMQDVIVRQKSNVLRLTEYAYFDLYVETDGDVNETGTRIKSRSSTTGGITWTDWVETDTVNAAFMFDLSGTSPKYRRYVSGSWGSWTTIATILKPSTLVLPNGGILSGNQAEACDFWLAQATPAQQRDVWGDLCMAALQDARSLSINTGMYLYELAHIAKSAKSLYSLVKGKWSSKTVASLFLTNRYGVQLTMADTLSIVDAAKREMQDMAKSYNWVRSTAVDVGSGTKGRFAGISSTCEYHYKVYYEPYDHPFATSLKTLMDIDLFPTLTNVWDFVPFSFVVDWFLDIGSLFERIDTRTYASTLSVLGTLRSEKRVVSGIPGRLFPFCGNGGRELVGSWTCSSYRRTRSKTLVLPRLILDAPREFTNYAELAAIVTTKL